MDNDGTYGWHRHRGRQVSPLRRDDIHAARLDSLDPNDIIDAKSTGDQQFVTIQVDCAAFLREIWHVADDSAV